MTDKIELCPGCGAVGPFEDTCTNCGDLPLRVAWSHYLNPAKFDRHGNLKHDYVHVPKYETVDAWPRLAVFGHGATVDCNTLGDAEHFMFRNAALFWKSTLAYADAHTQPTTEKP